MMTYINKQIFKLLSRILENFPDLMSSERMQYWIDNPTVLREALNEILCNSKVPLLDFVSRVIVPANTNKFVARDHFTDGNLCSFFKEWFLNGDSKVEDPIKEQNLLCTRLRQESGDGSSIINELKDKMGYETTLWELFFLKEQQKNGEKGTLLNDGRENIFFIRDMMNILRVVDIVYRYRKWNISATSVESYKRWGGGSRVFFGGYVQYNKSVSI